MTATDNRSLAYQVYEAINARDIRRLGELFAPNFISHASGITSLEATKKALDHHFTAFPASRFVVEDLLVDGDRAALRVTIEGVPVEPGQPKPVIMEIFRIEKGRVVEIWGAGTMRVPAA